MNTNNSKHPVYQFLTDSIKTAEDIKNEYGVEVADTLAARLQFVVDTFRKEYDHEYNRIHYGNGSRLFAQWLMGIPSVIHIPFYYHEIIKLAKEWGSIPQNATERQEDKICENWYNFISVKFHTLCKRNGVTAW
jgi:hypothetical protein